MCLIVVLRRFPFSSHSSSTSILVLSPFLFSDASHSFCGGAHPFPLYASRTCFTPGAGATYDFGKTAVPVPKLCSGTSIGAGVGEGMDKSGGSLVVPLEALVVVVVAVGKASVICAFAVGFFVLSTAFG